MKTIQMTDELYGYVLKHCPDVSPVLQRLREETAKLSDGMMQVAPDQGALMYMLAKLIGAKRIVEVGCFTGYSAICMAQALPADGRLITLDVDPVATKIATRYFKEAGLEGKIELRLGDGVETLAEMRNEFGTDSFDMMFIDADKPNYAHYYEHGLRLVRPGGLILADNVLWSGKVIDPKDERPQTAAIRAFNEKLRADNRVDRMMLHISDGIYVLRKK